jgi:hypothetical protein
MIPWLGQGGVVAIETRGVSGSRSEIRRQDKVSLSRGAIRPSSAVCMSLRISRGRRECRVPVAPMAPCAMKSTGVGTTGTPDQPGIPCTMVLRLIRALPGDHGLVATVASETREHHRRLSACFGAPEPHDFAVRMSCARLALPPRPPHPTTTFVTTAKRPS